MRVGKLPGQLHFRVYSCSVITQNSFKFLGLIHVINGRHSDAGIESLTKTDEPPQHSSGSEQFF